MTPWINFIEILWLDKLLMFFKVYRYIPSQKWDLKSILYTSWSDKDLKIFSHSEGAKNIDFTY